MAFPKINILNALIKRVLPMFGFFSLCLVLLRKIDDFDIWYHLAIGREIFQSLKIPATEIFVYPLLGEQTSYQEWGFGLLYYAGYRLMNYWGISFLNALIGAGTLAFLLVAARKKEPVKLSHIFALSITYWIMQFRFIYRPEMMLYLFLAAEIYLLERFDRDYQFRWLIPIPALTCLLSNFHPSAIFLLGVFSFYCLEFVISAPKRINRITLISILLSVISVSFFTAALNPYTFNQVLLPFTFAQQTELTKKIIEFMPVFQTPYKWHFVLVFLIGLVALVFQSRRRIVDCLLFLSFSYLSFRYVRNLALFALVIYVPFAQTLTYHTDKHLLHQKNQNPRWIFLLSAFLLLFLIIKPLSENKWGAGVCNGQFPVESASMIAALRPPGKILNFYDTGGYLSWKLFDQYQVFINGRRYFNDKSFVLHNQIFSGERGWEQLIDTYNIGTIVTPATLPFSGKTIPLVRLLAEDDDWILVVVEPRNLLFLRKGLLSNINQQLILDKKLVWWQIIKEAEKTLGENSGAIYAYLSIGDAYLRLGNYQKAQQSYKAYLTHNPQDKEATEMLNILQSYSK